MSQENTLLPGYTNPAIKQRLLDVGASGTVYALVMPESEKAIQAVVDRRDEWLAMFREPWTQKQDTVHVEYFDRWIEWTRPVVDFAPDDFPFRYPTSGSSEGIYKLMSEYEAKCRLEGRTPRIHIFEGEYEGFPSFAESLNIEVTRHPRADWRGIDPHDGQFWISQPSAIDGMVWDEFDAFCERMHVEHDGRVEVVPDLSYVGAVAREYVVALTSPAIRSFVFSHSKPCGGYYHRCGGVFSKEKRPSMTGNQWFKNLTSIVWGCEMMKANGVFDLPRRYRRAQEESAFDIGGRLGIEGLEACDVMVLAKAPVPDDMDEVLQTLVRGKGATRILRICLTPDMTVSIDPKLAPEMTRRLTGRRVEP